MFRRSTSLKVFLSLTLLSSLFTGVPGVMANDIIPSDDLTGGASAFVFRGSSKRPQARAEGRAFSRRPGARSERAKISAQADERRKRNATLARSRAAEVERARARQRNAKLRQSNVLTARAESLMEKGSVDAAIVDFRAALELNPKNEEASTGLSDALTVKGIETAGEDMNEAAAVYFEEAATLNPKNEIAFAKLGALHDALGRGPQAIENYEKALALDPEMTSLYQPLGLAHADAGDPSKAELYLTKAEQAGTATPDSRLAKAVLLARQNRNDEAIAALDQLITADPKFAPGYYQKGRIYDATGQAEAALLAYGKAVETDPAMAEAWFDMGVAYYNKGDYANAERAYHEVLKHDPDNAKAHANLASVYRQQERFADANAQYKAANEKGINKDPDLYSEWGYCLGKTNDWQRSEIRLKSAEQLSPTAIDHNNVGWAQYNAARAEKQAGNDEASNEKMQEARASFERSASMDPTLSAAFLNLGSANNALGDFAAAAAALDRALRLNNDWVIALNQLGLAHRGSNNLSAALTAFDRAVTIDGNNVFGLFNLGSVQNQTGDKKGAKKTQDRLKKLNPELANQLGNMIAGRAIDAGKQKIREKIRIPRIPF